MHRSTSLLLAIVVLAHSLAGCCSHHAHAAQASEAATCYGHVHSHEHEHSENGSKGEEPVDSCDEGSCVFLRGDSSPSVESDLALSFGDCVTVANQIGLDSLQFAHVSWVDSRESAAPHTRIHLLHQILLI